MAKGNYEAYFKEDTAKLKKYLYVLRPLLACCWIKRTNEMAPMEFSVLVEKEILDIDLKNEINLNLKIKFKHYHSHSYAS